MDRQNLDTMHHEQSSIQAVSDAAASAKVKRSNYLLGGSDVEMDKGQNQFVAGKRNWGNIKYSNNANKDANNNNNNHIERCSHE